jgi:hypothetical protein
LNIIGLYQTDINYLTDLIGTKETDVSMHDSIVWQQGYFPVENGNKYFDETVDSIYLELQCDSYGRYYFNAFLYNMHFQLIGHAEIQKHDLTYSNVLIINDDNVDGKYYVFKIKGVDNIDN